MTNRLVVYCTSKSGVEQVWLVDEVIGELGEDLRLLRSDRIELVIGPEDYAGSLVIAPFDGTKKH